MLYNTTKEEFFIEIFKKQYPANAIFTTEQKKQITKNLKRIFDLILSENFTFNCQNIKFLEDISNDFFCIMMNYCNRYNKSLLKRHFANFVLDLYNYDFFNCCYIYLKNLCEIFFSGNVSLESFLTDDD